MVDDYRAEVCAQELRAVVADERCEVGHESDGGVVHEVLHHLEHRVCEYADAASDGTSALAERLEQKPKNIVKRMSGSIALRESSLTKSSVVTALTIWSGVLSA